MENKQPREISNTNYTIRIQFELSPDTYALIPSFEEVHEKAHRAANKAFYQAIAEALWTTQIIQFNKNRVWNRKKS